MTLTMTGLIWLIAGVACFLLEMALPSFIVFFFGVGAWITAIICWIKPVSLNGQLATFLVSSLVTLFTLRGYAKKRFFLAESEEDKAVSVTIGDQAEVVDVIAPPAEGKISCSGIKWRAIADEKIDKGNIVTIVAQDGLCMKVTRS